MMIPKRNSIQVVIPDDVKFADLELVRDGGNIRYNPETMKKIIEASQIDPDVFLNWNNLSTLLVKWHEQAVKEGQPQDPLVVELMSEVMDEIGRKLHFGVGNG